METVYDWATVMVFAGLIVLFLHRSDAAGPPRDHLWQYLLASTGCAVVNYLGNEDRHLAASVAGAAVLLFILIVLRPFGRRH